VHWDLGLEHLLEVPGDGLALPVLVRREEEFVGVLKELLELRDLLLLVGVTMYNGSKPWSTLTPSLAQSSPLYLAGTSDALPGRSRMWPMLDSTT